MAVKQARRKKKDNTTSEMIGAGTGVVGGAATGAAVGALGGPVGVAVGAVVGGVAGGFAGKAVADYIDPEEEDRYWQDHYTERPYYRDGVEYDQYRPAYRYGLESASRYPGQNFDEIEGRLSRNWPKYRGDQSPLTWSKVREAVRDAHDRTIKLHEERLRIDTEPVKTGEVQIRKEVVTEQQKINVPVEREEVVITRKKVHGKANRSNIGPASEEIRIPVKEEKVKVSKEAVVTEEVDVSKRKVRDVEQVDDTIRKEELRVEEKGSARVNHSRSRK